MVLLVFQALWCIVCGPHHDIEHVDGVLELSMQHFQEDIDCAIWARRLIVCEGPNAFSEGTLIKDGIVKPLSGLSPLCFILSNMRFKFGGVWQGAFM